jgi:predicted nucleic acid-binding protein
VTSVALDTSVAVPLLLRNHIAHREVVRWWGGREVALSGHAAVETYAVLTRLPGDSRLSPAHASRLLAARFEPTLLLSAETSARLPQLLGELGVAGGAAYDALVALAAAENGMPLATRDARARDTYQIIGQVTGATVVVVG